MIHFKKSKVKVEPQEKETVLQAADRKKVKIRRLCEEGLCGTCKVKLFKGEVEMKNKYGSFGLYPNERKEGIILACVSFPQGDVEIEA